MSEAPKPIPEELLKPRSSRRRESSSFKSGAELGAALAVAGEKVEAEKKKKISLEERNKLSLERHRKAMERLDERNAKILAEKEKIKEPSQDEEYESYEVSGGEIAPPKTPITSEQSSEVSGEINITNKHVIRRGMSKDTHEAMKEAGLDKNKDEKASAAVEEAKTKKRKEKVVTSDKGRPVSGEINNDYILNEAKFTPLEENKQLKDREQQDAAGWAVLHQKIEVDRQKAKESRSDEARTDYIEAYKKYDPRFTKNKSDDQIAKTKPPFFAFGKAVRELRKLHGIMVRAEDSRVGGLSPEARQDIIESGQFDEEMEVEKMKQDKINK